MKKPETMEELLVEREILIAKQTNIQTKLTTNRNKIKKLQLVDVKSIISTIPDEPEKLTPEQWEFILEHRNIKEGQFDFSYKYVGDKLGLFVSGLNHQGQHFFAYHFYDDGKEKIDKTIQKWIRSLTLVLPHYKTEKSFDDIQIMSVEVYTADYNRQIRIEICKENNKARLVEFKQYRTPSQHVIKDWTKNWEEIILQANQENINDEDSDDDDE